MTARKIVSLLLCILLFATLIAGCVSTTPSSDPVGAEPAASDADVAAEPNVDATRTEAPGNEDGYYDLGGLTLPLVEEPTTLTVFRNYTSKYLTNPSEIVCNQIAEERTGIHIEWNTYSATEQFPLYVAAQEFDDMIWAGLDTYTGGIDKAVEDEVYIACNDYLQYMPNFSRYLASDSTIEKQCKTDSGNLFFNNVQSGNQPAWIGPMVRLDWLADCGLDTPVTFEDWHEMLLAFRDQLGKLNAMMLSQKGYSTTGFGILPGYDTVGTFYAENGSTVKYGFLDEGMREYIAMLAQWFGEGLIDKDFVSHTIFADATSTYVSDSVGAFDDCVYTFRSILPASNPDEDDDLAAVPYPSRSADEQGSLHFRRVNDICGTTPIFVTTAAVTRGVDVLCAQWIDYRYSEDGAYLYNYGEEDKTWVYGEDSTPHLTDFYLHNEEYLASDLEGFYCDNRYGGYYMWVKEYDQYEAKVLEAYDTWTASSTGDWVMPPTTMTASEAEDYSSVYGNIETYVDEMVLRFIVGDQSMNEWDSFVDTIESMGIQSCIDFKQAALDRYNAR